MAPIILIPPRRALIVAALTLVSLWPANAGADGDDSAESCTGDDEVSLTNGGMLRGKVVAVEPDKHVVIVVCGKRRTIEWSEVDEVERGKHAGSPAQPDESSEPDEPDEPSEPSSAVGGIGVLGGLVGMEKAAPPAPQPGVVRIHIASDDPNVRLFRTGTPAVAQVGGVLTVLPRTEVICQSPCDTIVDGRNGADFFFGGDGVPISESFQLEDKTGDLVARVDAGYGALHGWGGVLLATGGTSVLLGGIFAIIGVATSSSSMSDLGVVGNVMLGAGAGLMVPGILMVAAGGTDFELLAPDAIEMGAGGSLAPVWRF